MVAKLLLWTLLLLASSVHAVYVKRINVTDRFRKEKAEDNQLFFFCKFAIRRTIEKVDFEEFPWKVSVLHSNEADNSPVQYCEGSLIHSGVILTDARCVNKKSATDIKVRAGREKTNTIQVRPVKEIVIHESFNDRNLHYNLALLFLESRFILTRNIHIVCIPSMETLTRCFGSAAGSDPDVPENIELPMLDNDVCEYNLRKTHLGKSFMLHWSFLCARTGERNTCTRDYGSSLVCLTTDEREKNHYYLAGVKSWNIECSENDVPVLYTKVRDFLPWIRMHFQHREMTLP